MRKKAAITELKSPFNPIDWGPIFQLTTQHEGVRPEMSLSRGGNFDCYQQRLI